MSTQLNPFPSDQQKLLTNLLVNATSEQLSWLSGYLTGLTQVTSNSNKVSLPVAEQQLHAEPTKTLTILYGTHTGHSESIALQLQKKATQKGIPVQLSSLDDYKVRNLNKEEHLALIVSTHGEGEPPLMAEALHEYIVKNSKANLQKLNYSVLALGDRSYNRFCQTGIDFDKAFKKLGGKEILPIVKCDVDYEANATKWINEILLKLDFSIETPDILTQKEHNKQTTIKYSRLNPFYAEVLDKRKITGRGSDKEVWHVELSLEGSGLEYEPGDTVGILTNNPPELVNQILNYTGFSPNTTITTKYDDVTLYEALFHHYEITVLNKKLIEDYGKLTANDDLKKLIQTNDALEEYLYGHDLLDLLQDYPGKITPYQLTAILRYLPPRLYSISSSCETNPDEVHITVSKVDFEHKNRQHKGACSTYLSERIMENEKVPVYIEKNINFRLPKEDNTPIIMIGAGTGVAPYRAFLQELEGKGRRNNSWLFFGERTFTQDFLYQVEWQKYLQKGVLGKIDLAFSRDQKEKIYIQHKLKEKASEVYGWIQKGAHLYICGNRKKMFNDVQNTLLDIIKTQGGITSEKAAEYLHTLRKEKRYQTDVY